MTSFEGIMVFCVGGSVSVTDLHLRKVLALWITLGICVPALVGMELPFPTAAHTEMCFAFVARMALMHSAKQCTNVLAVAEQCWHGIKAVSLILPHHKGK